jgi:hypothetical protein
MSTVRFRTGDGLMLEGELREVAELVGDWLDRALAAQA